MWAAKPGLLSEVKVMSLGLNIRLGNLTLVLAFWDFGAIPVRLIKCREPTFRGEALDSLLQQVIEFRFGNIELRRLEAGEIRWSFFKNAIFSEVED